LIAFASSPASTVTAPGLLPGADIADSTQRADLKPSSSIFDFGKNRVPGLVSD
jgi:hypothetical protein